jgi:HEAT repeat protein
VSTVGRFFRVQPGEERNVGLVVTLTFVTFAGATIGESGVGALFFERIGADALPTMYLAQGATGIAVMLALAGTLSRFDRLRAYTAMPLLVAALFVIERLVLGTDADWIYPVLWLTATASLLPQAIFVWGTAGAITDTRRAKRLFPLFAAGGILGSVLGGLATRPLAALVGTENLLLVWASALVGASLLCGVVLRVRRRPLHRRVRLRRRPPAALRDLTQGLSFVRRSRLLVWMTIAAVLFSALYYSLYLSFAQAATARYADPEELAGFFGVFWAVTTAAAFLVSTLLANRLLVWFGAAAMVVVLPVLYAGSFGVLLATSSFTALVAVRFGVNVWLQGVSSPAWETLNNVVPETRRDQVRAFINGGPTQVGTAIAGVVTLVGQQALTARQLSVIGLSLAAVTIVAAWLMRGAYTGALVAALREGRPSVFEDRAVEGTPIVLERDGQALDLALGAARDPDPRVRRLAAEMLEGAGGSRVRDAIEALLDDEDATVRAHAVRALGDDRIDPRVLERALSDDDAVVRRSAAIALRAATSVPEAAAHLEALTSDRDHAVAAASAVGLLAVSRRDAVERLRRLLSERDPDARLAVLGELADAPGAVVWSLVEPVMLDGSPAVRARALRTLATSVPDRAIPIAMEALQADDDGMREVAFDVLSRLDVREHAPTLVRSAEARVARARQDHELARSIPPDGAAPELLRDALIERARSNALVALYAVALVGDDRDSMRTAIENLRGTDPGQLANALETLDASEHQAVARPLLALWEDTAGRATGTGDWIDAIARDADPFIRSCVELIRTPDRGDDMARSKTTMSLMERVLVLRTIPLFAELSPRDLQRVAQIAEERTYAAGDVIAGEGEVGDELHLIVDGMVTVVRGTAGEAVARRGGGDVVGEMSIITSSPRMASLVAEGDVRTLRIGHREFESMIRERPDVSIAVMRVLAERLGAQTADR